MQAGTVGDGLAAHVGIGNLLQRGDRISGCHHLREVVTESAYGRVAVTIAGCKRRPAVRQEAFRSRRGNGGAVLVYGRSLTPYTYIRIVFLHEFHEVVIVVGLVGPHSVLYVPAEHPQSASFRHGGPYEPYVVQAEAVISAIGGGAGNIERTAAGNSVHVHLYMVPGLGSRMGASLSEVLRRDEDMGEVRLVNRVEFRTAEVQGLAVDTAASDDTALFYHNLELVIEVGLEADVETVAAVDTCADERRLARLDYAPGRGGSADLYITRTFLAAEKIYEVGNAPGLHPGFAQLMRAGNGAAQG